ncbi:MAG: tetratricopeptide repeat protein [Treponemataceae bacterium]
MVKILKLFILCIYISLAFVACNDTISAMDDLKESDLRKLLADETIDTIGTFTIINELSQTMLATKNHDNLVLFLTDYVERHPTDPYNAYWLLMVAHSYLQNHSPSVAEYYFDRIINNYNDLLVKNTSVHLACLQNLIKISKITTNRISYFNQLIDRFPDDNNITELYIFLALEYERAGEWDLALQTYMQFLAQPNATTIQIMGMPDAYNHAKKLIDFNLSSKDWTFESLDALSNAILRAINNGEWWILDRYKSKVNFFSMSWSQDPNDPNSQRNFSMRSYMDGRRIRYNDSVDDSSSPHEAYLRTWGWTQNISVWYLYFRKVVFPSDPEIHGRWEWAGIYFGEKL